MCRPGTPCLRTSSATKCGVISSRRFPRWTGPDGLIPDAHVGGSPGCLRIASARTSPAVRTTQSSAGATDRTPPSSFPQPSAYRSGRVSRANETPDPVRQNAMDPGFHAVAGRLRLKREVPVGLEFAAVPGGQDDLGHQVGAQAELVRDLFRPPSLLVVEQREFLLGLGPRPARGRPGLRRAGLRRVGRRLARLGTARLGGYGGAGRGGHGGAERGPALVVVFAAGEFVPG